MAEEIKCPHCLKAEEENKKAREKKEKEEKEKKAARRKRNLLYRATFCVLLLLTLFFFFRTSDIQNILPGNQENIGETGPCLPGEETRKMLDEWEERQRSFFASDLLPGNCIETSTTSEKRESDSPNGTRPQGIAYSAKRPINDSIQKTVPEELKIIRIATWNLSPFDFEKITDPQKGTAIARIIELFDLVAIQGIRARNNSVLESLVWLLHQDGKHFAWLSTTTKSRESEYVAFVYNTDRLEVDRSTTLEVNILSVEPVPPVLSASFRVAKTAPDRAFTFTAMNVQFPQELGKAERDALYDVYQTVRRKSGREGWSEDDIILLGSFGVGISRMGKLSRIPGLVAVHSTKSTTLSGLAVDNIIFDSRSVAEYTERFGVLNLAEYYSPLEGEVRGIAEHRPVWADFQVLEAVNVPTNGKSSYQHR